MKIPYEDDVASSSHTDRGQDDQQQLNGVLVLTRWVLSGEASCNIPTGFHWEAVSLLSLSCLLLSITRWQKLWEYVKTYLPTTRP